MIFLSMKTNKLNKKYKKSCKNIWQFKKSSYVCSVTIGRNSHMKILQVK